MDTTPSQQRAIRDATDRMAYIAKRNRSEGNNERDHLEADETVCYLLRALGCNEFVDQYDKISKWYA